ncbi:MAG: type II and III secretion system protein family protein, partial [Planctomyces sp.]
AIQALRGLSYARSLAEPNLVAMNGQTASFQAGGEFPVPVVTGATNTGLQGVEFVPFGVQLRFTPFISDGNRIRLNVAAEVSTRNTSTGATVGGSSVSGRDTRNFSTVVELRSGQTMAVAGLIQTTVGGGSDKVPGAGDLPVVGWLFGSQRTSSNEQELVILVTPELVSPLDAAELPAHLPGSDVFEPDDMEFYVLNRLESRHKEDARMSVRTDWDRLIRTRSIERKYIIGPTGHSDGR